MSQHRRASGTTSKPHADRRRGGDRRQVDKGPPPGLRERRVGVEPRGPEVSELEMSREEWEAVRAAAKPPLVRGR